ncbi:MAG: CHAP domain-containing protein [Janthinobacterium lividum]
MVRVAALLGMLTLAACGSGGGGPGAGASTALECAPFARQVTGIQLYGDASTWWDQAAGRYERGAEPVPGGVLVFRRTGRLAHGHVSVVSDVVSSHEIRVTQANWVHRRIGRDEPVVDVSPGGDWSLVRVWWAPSRAMGTTAYPTYGFISPGRGARPDLTAGLGTP